MEMRESISKEGLKKELNHKTIQTYQICTQQFLKKCDTELNRITKKDVESYLDGLIDQNKASNTLNVHLNVIKFFFEKVLKRKLTVNIAFSKVPKRLPEFLTQEEVAKLLNCIYNFKQKLIVSLLYSTGLRVSELVNLKVKDLLFKQNCGWVRQGKGKKDRLFVIAQSLKPDLKKWVAQNQLQPEDWLFSSISGQYSVASVRAIIKQAAKKAKINKKVHPHTLRHSFDTYLIQNGYAVTEVQPLLGHSKIETTLVYLHLASPTLLNVKNPYDQLKND